MGNQKKGKGPSWFMKELLVIFPLMGMKSFDKKIEKSITKKEYETDMYTHPDDLRPSKIRGRVISINH